MPRTRRALTLTELLTVTSVIAILASMVSPILVRGRQEALREACIGNTRQIYAALSLYANGNFGNFPRCFDLGTADANGNAPVLEQTWWFRRVWRITNPAQGELDTGSFSPHQAVLRCPASRDPFNQAQASSYTAKVQGTDKDRVYDDSYGYNAWGSVYGPTQVGYGFIYSNATVPSVDMYYDTSNPTLRKFPGYAVGRYYHTSGAIAGRFRKADGKVCPTCYQWYGAAQASCSKNHPAVGTTPIQLAYIGAFDYVGQAAATILLMDYCKADANAFPGVDEGTQTIGGKAYPVYGYAFRHGDKANVLFADGHSQGYRSKDFFPRIGTPALHWQVYR